VTTLFSKRRNPIVEGLGQLLLLMSFIVAVLYGGGWHPVEGLWPVLTKGATVSLLALFVLINLHSFNHFLLFLALIASVAGDVFLALPGDNSFLRGLIAFLVGHVIFIVLYLKNRSHAEDVTALRVRLAAVLWAIAAAAAYFLYPHLGDMLVPVFVYAAVLTLMATAALFSKYPVKLVAVGALFFVISDAVLGARQFMNLPDFTGYIVWSTYYLAQLMMTLGVMLTDERPTNYGGYRFD
jgi:uncharacterized membrane protein YhhN